MLRCLSELKSQGRNDMPDNPINYLWGLLIWVAFSVLLLVAYVGLVSVCNWLGKKWRGWRYGI